ncbi:MAG: hydratase [Gammaproteobacteria bacterium]|nr:hydratase [Gammaproteobacteria bacterium]MYD75570.1 hydratase [Gammaproteobacteria bacterium]MYJ51207.1 hydratase [Gammaproteobacteria bacterium]
MGNEVIAAAECLLSSRQGKTVQDNLPPSCYPGSAEEAYRVQEELVSRVVIQHDSRVIGYKLACTNRPLMELLGTDEPFYGCLMEHSTHASGAELAAADFTQRIVESEFMLEMGADLPASDTPYTAETIAPFVGKLIPAIEVVDHRYTDFTKVGVNALIADNAIHGASVLGEPDGEKWKTIDLAAHEVVLQINGEVVERGSGANVLGSPLNAMAWLGNRLQSRGKGLRKGDIVTTGAACPIYHAVAGDRILVSFGELGEVDLSFA